MMIDYIYNNVKTIKDIILFSLFALLPFSCIDFNDTTQPVKATIQLVKPENFVNMTDLSGITVTLQSSIETITVTTDAEGKVYISELAPDAYDISVASTISHAQYEQYTGETAGGNMDFTLSGMLNQQVITTDGTISLPLLAFMQQQIIIGKVYPSYSQDPDIGSSSLFTIGKYLELYNNSDNEVDAGGLYIGLLESEMGNGYNYKVYPYDEAYTPGILHMKQVFRIPADMPEKTTIAPGGTLLLVNSAFDYSDRNAFESDLSGADFEAKDMGTTSPVPNNADVTALELIHTAYKSSQSTIYNMNLMEGGPTSLVIFSTTEDVSQWPTVMPYGLTTSTRFYMEVPVDCVLDGVEILKHRNNFDAGANINEKRLFADIDAGFISVNSINGRAGEKLVRKTLTVMPDGRKMLKDTNNSTNDFICTVQVNPREYKENNDEY